jgi:hypothetical protein
VNAYVIAVMTSLNCGLDVLCFGAVEPDSTGEHAQIYPSLDACIAVPADSALPYYSKRFKAR